LTIFAAIYKEEESTNTYFEECEEILAGHMIELDNPEHKNKTLNSVTYVLQIYSGWKWISAF
jgi:hypothetical protein